MSDRGEVGGAVGVTFLVASFPVATIIYTQHGKIGWAHVADSRQAAYVHQEFTVAADDQHSPFGLREGESQTHRGRCAHGATE